jgi:flagellar motor switch protein FliM
VIIARFALLLEGHEVPVSVMVPGEGLIASMRAGQNSEQRTPEELAADAAARARLERAVQEAPVDVRVRFRTVTVRSRDVAALAVGDLLRLRHPAARPLDVVVGDRVLAQAAVGTHGSQLAGLVVHVKEKP